MSSSSEDELPKKVSKKESKAPRKKAEKRPRKESTSDDGVEDDSAVVKTTQIDGQEAFELANMRYVMVRQFKGKTYVDIREYYTDKASGSMKPGKKGISMSVEQYERLKNLLPELDKRIK
ncbi:unnamed protein product [Auanema sp. JU1783]|nr:unnamed protein product [Auanema sp. JU1783]